ncbi:MAG: hypothetical protein EBW54_11075, partial [Betaproteobacteria bacterium]|nr:hypothetical protein [Betaproteobacteria bacterium]
MSDAAKSPQEREAHHGPVAQDGPGGPGGPGGPDRPDATDGPDSDPLETKEWLDALASLIEQQGAARARFVLNRLAEHALASPLHWRAPRISPYANTIAQHEQPVYPGDLSMEERLASTMRWNALAMVARANAADAELGGHIASYASAADLFEVG